MFLVRGDGYLGGGDIHIDVAAVQVVGTQTLQVTGQFLAGVLVVVLEEGQPVGGLQLEQGGQVFIREDAVADHVDVLDGGDRTFVDGDLQRHTVARLRNHFSLDFGGVAALGHILAQQLVAHAFEGGALEDLAFGQAGLLQTFHQVFGGDRLVTLDLDGGDRRALGHVDHQHVAFAAQLDILEEAGLEQRAGGLTEATLVDLITDVQRQGTKQAAGGNPLQAVDADI